MHLIDLLNAMECRKNSLSFFAKGIFKVHLMTVSFIPKEMSKHLKEKLSEMEGRRTHVKEFLYSFCASFLHSIASKWFSPVSAHN